VLPIQGPITPYRRVCGAIFIFIAAALAPNVHFAVKLATSPRAAGWTIWGMLALYVLVILVPGLRQVGHLASMVTLVIALVLTSLAMACSQPVKQLIATATGFYADAMPWQGVRAQGPTWTYRNPFAGYRLQVPRTWVSTPGPIEGTSELSRQPAANSGVVGRLRPSCDLLDEPLPMTVEPLVEESAQARRHCSRWQGLEACLVERSGAPSSPDVVRWQWLGRERGRGVVIRLLFDLRGEDARNEALAIINSLDVAALEASACPNPMQWAEFSP
jgi:hypothetical protein